MDIGDKISSDLSFHLHIDNLINGTNKLIGMALRTFKGRSRYLMVTIWKTIIQPKLDYCSQLWSPGDQLYITKLENLMRTFTSKIHDVQGLTFWERLQFLQLYSQERRRERYQLIFIWKVSQNLVSGYNINFTANPRRGRLADVRPINRSAHFTVKRAIDRSLCVKGAKMFNLLPQHIRNIDSQNVDTFKFSLDQYLSCIPDQPTIPDQQRAAVTNSLLDQIPMFSQ